MAKVLKSMESTDVGVKGIKNSLSLMSQLVDSHSTSIKQLEYQIGQLSSPFKQWKNVTFPRNTIQNTR